MNNQRRHKMHHRPTFAGPIENVTVNVGREATLECLVNHLDKYKVKVPWVQKRTILFLIYKKHIIHQNNTNINIFRLVGWRQKTKQFLPYIIGWSLIIVVLMWITKIIGMLSQIIVYQLFTFFYHFIVKALVNSKIYISLLL